MIKSNHKEAGILCCLVLGLGVVGCAWPSRTPPRALSISITPHSPTVPTLQSVVFDAVLLNDLHQEGVTWSLAGAGSLTNRTASSVTYTAPAALPSPATVTLMAVSVADSTKSASTTITITGLAPTVKTITVDPSTQIIAVGDTARFQVEATGSGPLHYQWHLNGVPVGTDAPAYTTSPAALTDRVALLSDMGLRGAMVDVTVTNSLDSATSNQVSLAITHPDQIAFFSNQSFDGSDSMQTNPKSFNLWVMKTDGTVAQPLTKYSQTEISAVGFNTYFAWSPDGSKVAFESTGALDGTDVASPAENIWVINADGTGLFPLTKLTNANASRPAWSPDGKKLSFFSVAALDGTDALNSNETSNLWTINADGSDAKPLTTFVKAGLGSSLCWEPARWSPDGRYISVASSWSLDGTDTSNLPSETCNIMVLKSDGSDKPKPLTQLTALNADSSQAAWSPDGKNIAFVSWAALNGSDAGNNLTTNIWSVNSDGSEAPTPLTKFGSGFMSNVTPRWSPDGRSLVYASQANLHGTDAPLPRALNIWQMRSDGTGTKPLTAYSAVLASRPIFSPDGTKIAIFSDGSLDGKDALGSVVVIPDGNALLLESVFNIWLMNADGTARAPLTKSTRHLITQLGWQP